MPVAGAPRLRVGRLPGWTVRYSDGVARLPAPLKSGGSGGSSQSRSVRGGVVEEVRGGVRRSRRDVVSVEEPLEIRLVHGSADDRREQSVAVTMRTPGHDLELALGFLRSEGIVSSHSQVVDAGPATDKAECNVVRVQLRPGVELDLGRLKRHFYTTSSCGVCSKASLQALELVGCESLASCDFSMPADLVHRLPEKMRRAQSDFARTGGLHAACLFDGEANLLAAGEDVGRHNAVDKVVGGLLLQDLLPASDRLLLVSGRSSFEILQKALTAGIPVVAAVGAPSSLAVDVARGYGMTLLGFVRDGGFNVYCGSGRIR